jgi:uncharacterized phage-associated protein
MRKTGEMDLENISSLRREKFALKSLKNLLEKVWRNFGETSPNYLLNISKEKSTWDKLQESLNL